MSTVGADNLSKFQRSSTHLSLVDEGLKSKLNTLATKFKEALASEIRQSIVI